MWMTQIRGAFGPSRIRGHAPATIPTVPKEARHEG
jgi:hypothetical protein